MKRLSLICGAAAFLLLAVVATESLRPPIAHAASELEVSGWIPYWRASDGARDAQKHLDVFTSLHPFGFTIKNDGKLEDLAELDRSTWKRLFREARREDVNIIPTVMTSNGALVHMLLSDPTLRKRHIREIVRMVNRGDFDGVDIDYEGKYAATKDYFSLFLKELKAALDDKLLTCAVEARTPPDSLYRIVPPTIEYANDLVQIGTHCDRVQVMTYDQQRADLKLNDARSGNPYIPVADTQWVRKVITHMSTVIPKNKLMLGIATYGHEYELIVAPNWYQSYGRIRALNPNVAVELAEDKDVVPSRNAAGEMSFTYWSQPPTKTQRDAKVPKNTTSGNSAAAKALSYANATGRTTSVNVVWWSDGKAIKEKVALAKELGVRGVAFFKIDDQEDHDMWEIFED